MAKQGWLTIRNVPDVPSQSGENGYFQQLVKFFNANCLCPRCKGKGAKQKLDGPIKAETTVRFAGIEALEQLNEMEDVSITDVIREILQRRCFKKRPCTLCLGSRFVSKERADEYKKLKKKKLKGKQRGKKGIKKSGGKAKKQAGKKAKEKGKRKKAN